MTNQRRILGILRYEFVTNKEVATLSLYLAMSGVWIRLLLHTKCYISRSQHDRAQDSLAPEEDNQVIHKTAGWSRLPLAQGYLLLMLKSVTRIGQHGGCYDPSTVKCRERQIMRLVYQC